MLRQLGGVCMLFVPEAGLVAVKSLLEGTFRGTEVLFPTVGSCDGDFVDE